MENEKQQFKKGVWNANDEVFIPDEPLNEMPLYYRIEELMYSDNKVSIILIEDKTRKGHLYLKKEFRFQHVNECGCGWLKIVNSRKADPVLNGMLSEFRSILSKIDDIPDKLRERMKIKCVSGIELITRYMEMDIKL